VRRLPEQTLPNDISPAATAAGESPEGAAVGAEPERRVSEQLITDWDGERRRLGHAPPS
jgi:hypothetical protein